MGLNMRKSVIFTIRGCFRSIYNHPFLVFLLCVLTFICSSSPFMFSLLLYVSPVFICTAVLLGTLLFFGQQNAHRIETKEKTTHENVPIKTELSKDSIVVENNKSRSYGERQKDNVERQTDDIFREDNKKRIRETMSDNSGEFDEKHNDERFISEKKGMENDHVDDILESEYEKSEAESYDSEMVNMDSLEPQSHSAWKRVKHGDDDDEEALDSEFDGAESSSPEASMPDMVPMLDELHPLLDEEATQLVPTSSRAVSEAPSEQSPPSSIGSIDETENPEDSEVPDDDEDAHNDKEDQAAIVWTEEDKRNLMDVGSSEMERNKRLESLLLRRRSWKSSITMVPEINLIDLESSDHFPYHMMHISTTRHNPFELPHDSDINSGLPPVPSSAPPVLLPRRNHFDVPFQPYFVPEVAMVSGEASYPAMQRASSESSVAETESVSSVENVVEDQKVEEEEEEEEEDDDDDVTHGNQSSEGEECLELGSGLEHRESRQSSVSSEREINNGEGSSMVADMISRQNSDTPVYDLSPSAEELDGAPILERVRTAGADDNNSDEDYVEANDKLISTPSAGGSTPLFHDRLLHEREFKLNIDTSSELDSMNVVDDQVLSKQLSSTDSKENKQLMISVKRRLSTPF